MNLRENKLLRKWVYIYRNFINKHSFNKGRNNTINNYGVRVSSRIQIVGSDNEVIIGENALLNNAMIRINGNHNRIHIGPWALLEECELVIEDSHCEVSIGEKTFVGNHTHIACTEDNSKIIIGADCMLSSNIQVRTGDSHSIVDLNGRRLNPAQSIVIGNHCWIGEGAKILKGVSISKDSVVSTGAIVTSTFGSNVIIAGVPAKFVKENINWLESRI